MAESAPLAAGAQTYGSAPPQITMTPALECLQRLSAVEVQEKASLIEAATALLGQEVEMANRYKVMAGEGKDQSEVLYAVEETDFCTRQAKQCCPDCAPWSVKVLHTEGGNNSVAFLLSRGFSCTCCCFNRPEVEITDAVSQERIGSIRDPWACCDMTFSVRDAVNSDIIWARGGCCQPGLMCPLPCGPCKWVTFDMEDTHSGKKIGQLSKHVPSCLKFLLACDVDNYKLEFGDVSDPRTKALLVALTIFIDFRYFSDNNADDSRAYAPN